jgi:hypothetical protein
MKKRIVLACIAVAVAIAIAASIRFWTREEQRASAPPDRGPVVEGSAPPASWAPSVQSPSPSDRPPAEVVSAAKPPAEEPGGRPSPGKKVERFLTVEAPARVVERMRMPVLVSLTELETGRGTEILSGDRTAEGKLLFPVGDLRVVLAAPAFDVQEALQTLSVRDLGDSEPVLFELVARPIESTSLESRLHVSLWRGGARIASAFRRVTIQREDSSELASAAPQPPPTPPLTRMHAHTSAPIHEPPRLPDLTLELWSDEGRLDHANVTIASPHRQTPRHEVWPLEDLKAWLETRMARVAGPGRGLSVATAEASSPRSEAFDDWTGLGRELYRRLAPPSFQQMFWHLADERGPDFRTIQIHTDMPWIPWELMRPCRPDGSGERGFLGAELSIGRWHLSERTSFLRPPPQRPRIPQVVVIAPRYSDERRLPAQDQELAGLRRHAPLREIPGQLTALKKLLSDLPQALVHFAGHGLVGTSDAGIPTYSIVLEDGQLDLTTWLGLSPQRLSTHPFFFFNSCDVGRSERVARFVEGWAPAALELGACGYIGSLCPLDDAGASAFAIEFYSRLYQEGPLHGRVADALRETRSYFIEQGDPVGLAYVFYGDPNLVLDL